MSSTLSQSKEIITSSAILIIGFVILVALVVYLINKYTVETIDGESQREVVHKLIRFPVEEFEHESYITEIEPDLNYITGYTKIDGELAILHDFDDETNEFIFVFPKSPGKEVRMINMNHLEPISMELI